MEDSFETISERLDFSDQQNSGESDFRKFARSQLQSKPAVMKKSIQQLMDVSICPADKLDQSNIN